VARGLGAAHRLGIIHRDLKPDNIFLTRSEEGELVVKVVDFGIAKLRESATHTLTGMVLGTPQYMSFEQASGMRSEDLDARSDLYSLGVIAYEMLTGRLPFRSDTPLGYLRKHVTEEPPAFHAVKPDTPVSGEIERVVRRALAKDREQRYGSVREFAQEFAKGAQAFVGSAAATLPPTRVVAPSSPATSPEPGPLGASGGGSVELPGRTPPVALHPVQPILQRPKPSEAQPSTGAGSGLPRKAYASSIEETTEAGYKPCPYCAEDIRVDAKACKHCGRKFRNLHRPGVGRSTEFLVLPRSVCSSTT
jgi:serine/threonine protein kinase